MKATPERATVTHRLLCEVVHRAYYKWCYGGRSNISPLIEKFGFSVRTRRNQLGVSQEELAERSGLHRTYIADIERGARNPSLRTIEKLARALDVSIPHLFTAATEGGTVAPCEILLVEDNSYDVRLTLRAFRDVHLSNRVHVCRDGVEAWSYLKDNQSQPGVILLDLGLPKLSGLELLRRVRSDDHLRAIPVVVLTASDEPADIDECRRLGVSSYIVKPVDFPRFTKVTSEMSFSWKLHKTSTC